MKTKSLIVVGDTFTQFSQHQDVISYSDLINLLGQRQVKELLIIYPGQGINRDKLDVLIQMVAKTHYASLSYDIDKLYSLAGAELCHKVQPENRLVTEPVLLQDNLYHMNLLVDERCELLSDHITGSHIQGMLLIEAARQSLLSVTEKFHCSDGQKYYFVINKVDSEFHQFCFPIEAEILYQIDSLEINKHKQIRSTATVEIRQGNATSVCTVKLEFTAFLADFLANKEMELSEKAVTSLLSEYQSRAIPQSLIA
ncbi:MAG: hypothetical protein HRU20_02000 [Pseudomonadales bacterium]|nr:hypothetical protein [Pseudomonadales bacterium]